MCSFPLNVNISSFIIKTLCGQWQIIKSQILGPHHYFILLGCSILHNSGPEPWGLNSLTSSYVLSQDEHWPRSPL